MYDIVNIFFFFFLQYTGWVFIYKRVVFVWYPCQVKCEAAYFIVVLHHLQTVVIAIRGTETPEDLITDGLCKECTISAEDLTGLIKYFALFLFLTLWTHEKISSFRVVGKNSQLILSSNSHELNNLYSLSHTHPHTHPPTHTVIPINFICMHILMRIYTRQTWMCIK